MQHQLLLVQYKQQANPLTNAHLYSTFDFWENDKFKLLILFRQRKLALTARTTFLQNENIGAPKKTAPSSFRSQTNHTCHQKPNPSRETVPLLMKELIFNF